MILYHFFYTYNHIIQWNYDRSPIPATFYLSQVQHNNFPVYKRMAHDIYDKLSWVSFTSTPHLAKMVRQDVEEQGGFLTLYNLCCAFHPNLIEDSKKPPKPKLHLDGAIWLWWIVDIIMTRRKMLMMWLNIWKMMDDTTRQRNLSSVLSKTFMQSLSNTGDTVFPRSLNITVIPNTIMSNYSEQEALG